MFDLTKQISLDSKNSGVYRKLQAALYLLALVLAIYVGYVIIFPTQYFTFSFPNPNSLQNTVISPRNMEGNFAEHGQAYLGQNLFFDTALIGNYSQAKVSFVLNKKSDALESATLEAKKSFQSFLYPEGEKMGFKDGTLIKNNNNYFIVSQGKLRKFSSDSAAAAQGFKKEAFIGAADEDLKHNETGENVPPTFYPDASLFRINDTYYILENQKLRKFISQNAYLSQYLENQAVEKSVDFLKNYPLDENPVGFGDGSLISYGISAFVVSNGKILPINNTLTFSAMGYDWKNVIAASGDEISLYEKDKLFTISSPHPDGTVFSSDDGRWYRISNRQKQILPTENIAHSWAKRGVIAVSAKSTEEKADCEIQKETLSFRTYSCKIPLEKFKDFIGKDYEFAFNPGNDVRIDSIDVSFEKSANWENFKSTARELVNKIKGNYVGETPAQ